MGSFGRKQQNNRLYTLELKIKSLGRQGDGIADGPVFVTGALPGEIIEGTPENGRVAQPKILSPSESRVKPICRHFKSCGGCQMQHTDDRTLADWKESIVADALAQVGLSADIRSVVTSPAKSRRRAKYAARRTKSGAMAGFYGRASDTIVDVVDCPLVAHALDEAPALCRALAVIGASRKGALSVLCTVVEGGLDVMVDGGKPLDPEMRIKLPQIATQFGVVRLIWSNELVAQTAPPQVTLGTAEVPLPPGAFLQATLHGQEALQACVLEATNGASRVLDLFAGCGTFALSIAGTAPVTAIEGSKDMAKALQQGANHAGLRHPVQSLSRDLFKDPLTSVELAKFEAIVLDPPRAGALAQVKQIAQSQVASLAYVSCDPASFARDAKELTDAGYALEWVQVVDQFRWSSHVELAAKFSHTTGK